jgi:hypothetical protein
MCRQVEVWDRLQSGCCPLLNLLSKVVWNEEIMDITLITLKILIVGSNRSILVVLCLGTASSEILRSIQVYGRVAPQEAILTGCWKPLWLGKKLAPPIERLSWYRGVWEFRLF